MIKIEIHGADVEETIRALKSLAAAFGSRAYDTTEFRGPSIVEVLSEEAKDVTPPAKEPKAKRGRPKKEAEPANDVAEPPTMTAAQAEDFMKGSKLPPEPATLEECLAGMRLVASKHGYDEVRLLMKAIGYLQVSKIPDEKRAAFIEMAKNWEPAKAAE